MLNSNIINLLITTIVVSIMSQLLRIKCVSEHQDLQILYYTNMSDFQPLEVVGRGSETQLQVDGKLNRLI